jgi:hypothetical protein
MPKLSEERLLYFVRIRVLIRYINKCMRITLLLKGISCIPREWSFEGLNMSEFNIVLIKRCSNNIGVLSSLFI